MPTQRQLFLEHLAQTSGFPLMLEVRKAKGVYLYRPDGSKVIDLIAGIGVSNVGHRHPQVISAIRKQMAKYLHVMVYGETVLTPQVKLAKALADTLAAPLSSTYLVNSGSEAVEGALKLAKRYTGRHELVSAERAYHGSSHGALSVTGDEGFKQAFRPLLPGVRHLRFNHAEDLSLINEKTAGVIVEVVQGEAGVRLPHPCWLLALRERCTAVGALLIFDEIQSGFGRTGAFWAHQHYGVVPDILTCAKGMGGGMPIGAFISSPEIMAVLQDNPVLGHITTFGGHPVSAAASLATLKLVRDQRLAEQAQHKAHLIRKYLQHPKIKSIRHLGLMMAVQFESFEVLKPILDKALELGVLSDWFLFCNDAMRIAPPLTITEAEIKRACKLILKAIDQA